jgi:hypothetical protein
VTGCCEDFFKSPLVSELSSTDVSRTVCRIKHVDYQDLSTSDWLMGRTRQYLCRELRCAKTYSSRAYSLIGGRSTHGRTRQHLCRTCSRASGVHFL